MGDFDGQVAIVTGAARGIGLATARLLAAGGARVIAVDKNRARSPRGAWELEKAQPGIRDLRVDVTEVGQVNGMVRQTVREFGRVDILVNNAGVAGRAVPLWRIGEREWRTVLDVNLTGTFYCTRAVVPIMRARKYGRIVNVSSVAGKEGNPNAVAYSASKAGVIGFTKAVAKEVAAEGILINCVTPGVVRTGMQREMSEAQIEYMMNKIPMGRAGLVEEVAELIAWLASHRCSFSTGAAFDISGGRATY